MHIESVLTAKTYCNFCNGNNLKNKVKGLVKWISMGEINNANNINSSGRTYTVITT